jgi:hypothetical protein
MYELYHYTVRYFDRGLCVAGMSTVEGKGEHAKRNTKQHRVFLASYPNATSNSSLSWEPSTRYALASLAHVELFAQC